jgi:hypothetical protein
LLILNSPHDIENKGNLSRGLAVRHKARLQLRQGIVLTSAGGAGFQVRPAEAGRFALEQALQAGDQLVAAFNAVHDIEFG